MNFTAADAQCELDVIPNAARALRVEAAISNSFAFGGLNAVLAFASITSRRLGDDSILIVEFEGTRI